MSHRAFVNNPIGFLKHFICKSHSLMRRAEILGFPNEPFGRPLSECSTLELLELALAYSDKLLDLQGWLVLTYISEPSEPVFKLIGQVAYLAKRYKIGKF